MGILDESKCYATTGYTGFIPSMMNSFGETYGSLTKKIVENDPCLLRNAKGKEDRLKEQKIYNEKIKEVECSLPWKKKVDFRRGSDDDRKTIFPPISGYQGFVTLSKDQFGKSFMECNQKAMAEFNYIQKNRQNTYAVQNIIDNAQPTPVDPTTARNVKIAYNTRHDPELLEDMSAYKLPKNHPQKFFVAGYQGHVPHIQNYFGESYSRNSTKAIDQFQTPIPEYDPYTLIRPKEKKIKLSTRNPIPGYTGYIPGYKGEVGHTYGVISEKTMQRINKHKIKEYAKATSATAQS
ncbi:hypothetical protein BCR32DRAFT_264122 [Anaeromyces robustus]|uniref:Ciliary microtubule inner protein 2A-C-like domain-containing protein n=1 Tax=Anaeromyces robustus TaxID=1754192 RepID=A0A1Y1XQW1_9FUNG|nr:hypothetical protein BCR32DRAFT_264122 [Anaeromyces robustus]|eukprot:ORX87704.1 hypothetical protein BCR32DRAFT_264122 [Anaeromyces robustus]